MCGIAGWVSFNRDLRSEQVTVDSMTETMSCRGPDDRALVISDRMGWADDRELGRQLAVLHFVASVVHRNRRERTENR